MLNIIGSKLSGQHGLGQKAKSVASKVGKVAMGGLAGGVATLALSGGLTQAGDAVRQVGRIQRTLKP
tara:strand:+ start:578 stop:778 length:201 start_codon:yes stop_codon:yes gene_type:complete